MSLEIKEILQVAEARLKGAGCEEAKTDAEELLCFLMKFDKNQLFMNWGRELDEKLCDAYFELLDVRASRRPLHYIIGRREFMGFDFAVNENVLIPRQDTEILVETVLAHMTREKTPTGGWRALEIGVGSGAVSVSLCKNKSDLKMKATDISPAALAVAKKNAVALAVADRIRFAVSDMFGSLRSGLGGAKYHVIVSNPPYIPEDVLPTLQPEISEYEPAVALCGGAGGLDAYRRILEKAHLYMKKRGTLFLEIGFDQADAVTGLIKETKRYETPEVYKDLSGNDRVVRAIAV
ncbi:MAG: peptide chain release factor N(5)-glutamine methyltransferase [Clostridiales Family XIII bacterium]|jgi:release factor glutamine methyltransferase|nr:peptide chain release factor N(5)-glutamine methyltransferase [Clostridiales Family XIII bacterium]